MRKGVIATTAIAFLLLALGCMSFSFGGRTEVVSPHESGSLADVTEQKGKMQLIGQDEITVYYPVPYASPPNLAINGPPIGYKITEQRADCFKIQSDGTIIVGNHEIDWTARGVKALPPAPVVATPTSPALAAPVTH